MVKGGEEEECRLDHRSLGWDAAWSPEIAKHPRPQMRRLASGLPTPLIAGEGLESRGFPPRLPCRTQSCGQENEREP